MKYPRIPKVKFRERDETVHRILIDTGNQTACGLGFTMDMGRWTKNFTTDLDKVTCIDCLEYAEKMKKDYELRRAQAKQNGA